MNLSGVNVGQIQGAANTAQPVSMQEGQVLHGTIKKLYPNQQAEINIGGQKMMAKLETPMQAGNTHFFQVTATTPDLTLKMVSGPVDEKASLMDQTKQMIDTMKLPQTKEMQQIVSQLVKNNIPFNKEQLIAAEQLLKGANGAERPQALDALQKMIELKLPMTSTSLQAVMEGSLKGGFTNLLGNLEQSIRLDTQLASQLKEAILQQLAQLKSPLSEQTGNIALGKLLGSNTPEAGQILQQAGVGAKAETTDIVKQLFQQFKTEPNEAIRQLLQQPMTKENLQSLSQAIQQHPTLTKDQQQAIQQAITRMQLAPSASNQAQVIQEVTTQLASAKESIPQLMSQLKNATAETQPAIIQKLATAIAENPTLTMQQKQEVIAQLGQAQKNGAENVFKALVTAFSTQVGLQPTEEATSQLSQLLGVSKDQLSSLMQNLTRTLQQQSTPFAQQMLQDVENLQMTQLSGHAVQASMKKTLSELGLSLEANILQSNPEQAQLSSTLKSLMHALVHENVTNSTRNLAEQVIGRMNGQQLLSMDQGQQQQIVMQIPLQFFGKRIDATLQWSGSKNKDGKIDSNFARIMFYLHLENLHETVIDMQVQSRVVTLNIYTENQQSQGIIDPLKEVLKARLAEQDYRLSGVFLKKFDEPKPTVKQQSKIIGKSEDGGVDFRI